MEQKITYEHVFCSTSNGVIVTDEKGHIVLINLEATKIMGLKYEEIIGKKIMNILPLTGEHVMKCLNTGKAKLGCHIYGKRIKLVLNVTAIREDRKIIGTVSNFQKMQQFEDSAHQLESYKRLNRQLDTIFRYSSDITWLYDRDGKVLKINRAAEIKNKIQAKNVIGKSYKDIVDMGITKKSIVPEVLKTRREITHVLTGTDGTTTWLNSGTPVFDENRNLDFIVVNARDMTFLNEMKEALEENRLVTEKMKDELAELSLLGLKNRKFVGISDKIRQVLKTAIKLSNMEASNILVLGESGTGKGLLAELIHNHSKRRKRPLIQINCAALPENLLEAELFGYEKGAFTGASKDGKAGLFELAHEGTLFLDEIGELPFSVQAKLLKYLDDQKVTRVGSVQSKKVDCTIIAATNRCLEDLAKKNQFRQDLFYRLNTFIITIPPLRDRPDDIFELVQYFLNRYNKKYCKKRKISVEAMDQFQSYPFPGNIREMKNILKRAVVMSEKTYIDDFILRSTETGLYNMVISDSEPGKSLSLNQKILAFEREILKKAMASCKTTRAIATYLKISQPTVVRKIKKHNLSSLLIH